MTEFTLTPTEGDGLTVKDAIQQALTHVYQQARKPSATPGSKMLKAVQTELESFIMLWLSVYMQQWEKAMRQQITEEIAKSMNEDNDVYEQLALFDAEQYLMGAET